MGGTPGNGEARRRHPRNSGRSDKYKVRPERPVNMSNLAFQEEFEEDKNSAFTWEVKANSRAYNCQFKEKVFLCWQRQKYKTNVIRTAKYNAFSFLPLNLFEQFQRLSNLYFLFVIILQSFPEISTLPWFALFIPLVLLLLLRAARDLVDDIRRHKSDKIINKRPCKVLMGKRFFWRRWEDICVGDVICLQKDSIVPADLLLLSSSEPSSLCYVETADIDGETNLKFRQAPKITHHELTCVRKMAAFQGKVVCQEPNSRMHHFVGCLEWTGKKYPLDSGNILLRGSRIRNTDTCYGMVIYADGWVGFDTKIMRNCGKVCLKRTKIDRLMNQMVGWIFVFLVLISGLLTFGFYRMVHEFKEKHLYLSRLHPYSVAAECFLFFWAFLILLSVMVPMAMFALAEFIYLGNSIFINWDSEMYYEPRDMPANARSTSLSDHLGQVQYVFSDKTGTLTQNIMTFNRCCIQGTVYGGQPPPHRPTTPQNPYSWNTHADGKLRYYNSELLRIVRSQEDSMVVEFWRLLAICHTVMVQEKNNQLVYQAASPDEEALVTAARNFGYVFKARSQDSITVLEMGKERVYRVLAMMDFNSARKRMSVLVRNPEGDIYLYTKGADIVIFERLQIKSTVEWNTEEVLASFARQTLRTLCLAFKKVDENSFQQWHQRHQEASILLQNRIQALQQVYEEMEQNLQLLGVTAIEDRLQDQVPETIQCLKDANIKVWVLTGDKQETAVNIAFACGLLSESMLILEPMEINRILEAFWENSSTHFLRKKPWCRLPKMFSKHFKVAMVITGDFLDQLLTSLRREPGAPSPSTVDGLDCWQESEHRRDNLMHQWRLSMLWQALEIPLRSTGLMARNQSIQNLEVQHEQAFVDLASQCQAVICCRVTPKQKAMIVSLVKKYQKVVTLAVGDGANDVNMIKTADIGVGLAGPEGLQAVHSSDFSLAQFSYLRRLLLVHGRWSYMRICKFLRYFIYKTTASMMVQIWFACYNGFTTQPLYEGWFLALFNLIYSTLPVLYIGLFEQDVSAEESLQLPQLYTLGQKDQLFNYWVFLRAVAHGTVTSLVNFFVTFWASSHGLPGLNDYQSFAVVVALSCLLTITVEVIIIITYWTFLAVLAIVISLLAYFVITQNYQSYAYFKLSPKTFPFLDADQLVLSQPFLLLVILMNVSLNTIPVLAFRFLCKTIKKPLKKEEDVAEAPAKMPVNATPYLQRDSHTRRSSYAFSHLEGFANLITQGTILRRSLGTHSDLLTDLKSEDQQSFSLQGSYGSPREASPQETSGHRTHRSRGSCEDPQPTPQPGSRPEGTSSLATATGKPTSSPEYSSSGSFLESPAAAQESQLGLREHPPQSSSKRGERAASWEDRGPTATAPVPESRLGRFQSQPHLSGEPTVSTRKVPLWKSYWPFLGARKPSKKELVVPVALPPETGAAGIGQELAPAPAEGPPSPRSPVQAPST
ncbi:phospholipid-transporting ATPase IK [Sorex araneus]|uniref:phospholipid-transporting ATPase IK n=1 Tax=Sorex araneus TaxID=42254 RepID=UPI002433A922|nr:phospholipid-transporting ATPase IK [Sorex araneus]